MKTVPSRGGLLAKYRNSHYICRNDCEGELAQLARALAWHARGHEFDSRILHKITGRRSSIEVPPPGSVSVSVPLIRLQPPRLP